jgi:hypothetical protein
MYGRKTEAMPLSVGGHVALISTSWWPGWHFRLVGPEECFTQFYIRDVLQQHSASNMTDAPRQGAQVNRQKGIRSPRVDTAGAAASLPWSL